jgi:hypothetical protein
LRGCGAEPHKRKLDQRNIISIKFFLFLSTGSFFRKKVLFKLFKPQIDEGITDLIRIATHHHPPFVN